MIIISGLQRSHDDRFTSKAKEISMLLLFLQVVLLPVTESLTVEKTVTPSRWVGHSTYFEKFGFDDGGSIAIVGTNEKNSNTYIYVCDQYEYQLKLSANNWVTWLCGSQERSTGYKALLNGETKYFTITKKDYYYFSVIDCSESAWSARLSYTLYSTDQNNQLSYDDIPLPIFYVSIEGIWGFVLLGWSIEITRLSHRRTPIHSIICSILFLKVFVVSLIAAYWWIFSSSGIRNETLNTLQNFLFAFPETALFGILYLVSKGWRITRAGLPIAEIRSTLIALLVLLSTLIFFSFYNTEYYWLSLILLYFFMLPKIFTSLTHNIRLVDSQLNTFTQSRGVAFDTSPFVAVLNAKRFMFSKLRSTLVSYLVSILLVNSLVRVLLMWEYSWVSKVADEVMFLFMFLVLCYHLHPSKNVFFHSLDDMRPLMAVHNFLQNQASATAAGVAEEGPAGAAAVGSRCTVPWDMSKTISIEWPTKRKNVDLTRMSLSLGYEVEYSREQWKLENLSWNININNMNAINRNINNNNNDDDDENNTTPTTNNDTTTTTDTNNSTNTNVATTTTTTTTTTITVMTTTTTTTNTTPAREAVDEAEEVGI